MTSEAQPTKGTIRVLQLYPRDMNIYGDWGNALVLQQRIKWHGYTPELLEYNVGDDFPEDVDIIVGGGGQDSGQLVIQDDLQARADHLRDLADGGAPMLVICGLYQLFGKFFKTSAGPVIPGIGILDVETHGTDERLIGNVTLKSSEFGDVLGYENHSGQTTLGPPASNRWGQSPKVLETTARTVTRAPATATWWPATCTVRCCPRTRRSPTS
ncbi:hypothetical protein StoSoilB13_09970 [Arthrobacter sp. StoSoilB13]|nr:hypothetical protein StoSoilB13_09970 [Arthrobacter sp. StoSoilB13]